MLRRPGPPEAPADPGGEAPDADPAAAAEALFAPGLMSFDTARVFEERYEGRTLQWSGTLKRARSYASDMVFGPGPGTRAVLLVHVLEQEGYGSREVRAVLQLPPEAEGELADRSGEELAFEGRLVSCDAFMRNLFVAEARFV